MYEDKRKKSSIKNLNVDWKALLIKLAILLVAIFVLIWLVSVVNKDKKTVESNLGINLQSMREAAKDYFVGSKLPTNVNGRKKITLNEMFSSKLLVEFKDQNNKACDGIGSFAEATKVNNTDYAIKVKLVCGSESDYVIDTVTYSDNSVDTSIIDNNDNIDNNVVDNNQTSTNTNTSSTNSNKKPSTSNNNSSNKNNTTSNNTTSSNITYVTTKPNTSTNTTNTCKITENDINSIIAKEYSRLNDEMVGLQKKTSATLYIEAVNNINSNRIQLTKSNGCITNYKVLFTMKQKVNYAAMTVYEYYLNSDGSRTVLTDRRSIISSSTGNNNNSNSNSTNVRVTSVTLNKTSIELDVNKTFDLVATINPSNATNKKITWTSSNTSVATVNSNGRVTALKAGNVTITATVDGKSASAKVTVNNIGIYCKYERVYSTSYVDASSLKGKYYDTITYQIAYNTNSYSFLKPAYNLASRNDYVNAYTYWKNKNNKLTLTSSGGTVIDAKDAANLYDHSLKAYNFTPIVNYAYHNNNTVYFNVTINLNNLGYIKDATPYYANGKYIYFLPLSFDVVSNNCVYSNDANSLYYTSNGYVKVN